MSAGEGGSETQENRWVGGAKCTILFGWRAVDIDVGLAISINFPRNDNLDLEDVFDMRFPSDTPPNGADYGMCRLSRSTVG